MEDISTHAPLARRNVGYDTPSQAEGHFYSRTSCEAQLCIPSYIFTFLNFYSRTSCEAQLIDGIVGVGGSRFLLTHLLRGAT